MSLPLFNMASRTCQDWPAEALPVELFVMIAQYLPNRKDLGSMRLVNREFNTKLACYFVRQLVIHLGPELSARLDTGVTLQGGPTSLDITGRLLQSDVFRRFGPDIRRLALTLELQEYELATPSTGDLEEICLDSADIHRRALSMTDLHPDLHLERVIQSLENARGVALLLTSASNVQELALSCDPGLGYLQGPDINYLQPPARPPVFGDPNQVRATDNRSLRVIYAKPYRLEMLEHKLAAAGVDSETIPYKIRELFALERTTESEWTHEKRARPPLPRLPHHSHDLLRASARDVMIRLQPDQLTDTQKRFLFLYLSAHQGLVQSFLLTVMDNGPSFMHLTKVNIARLPSLYVEFLFRHDFWSRLPGLQEVALGVIPDWRTVYQQDIYDVAVEQVFPTDALPKVFRLLNDYIGKQPRIKRLHFEWHCGGEFAAGCMQRNRYVLPAPFLKSHLKVVNSSPKNLLILPFITHLSLKNCWFAPNVFYRIMDTMARDYSLESLELETVSLSGPPIHRRRMRDVEDFPPPPPIQHQHNHAQQQLIQHHLAQFHLGQQDQAPQNPPQQNHDGDGVGGEDEANDKEQPLREPPWLSWCHILDMLTPGETIKELAYKEGEGRFAPPLRIIKELKLRKLIFKSCGYVDVPDFRFISNRRFKNLQLPPTLIPLESAAEAAIRPTRDAVGPFLQNSTDRHLGKIRVMMDPWERAMMRRIWQFNFGWVGTYEQIVVDAARQDGVFIPGYGRFTGTIERDPNARPEKETTSSSSAGSVLLDEPVHYVFNTSLFDRDYNDHDGLTEVMLLQERKMGYYSEGGLLQRLFDRLPL
ncbi:hypothetical protein F4776DRAFT_256001 [Hypoxylon sp. NC0597]|nr:hypothetical protein F4776DRAFT_256001 [Hypoxylon sp. NC0597]